MLIRNLTKREKLIFFATIALAAAMVLYGFILEPAFRGWRDLNEEIEAKTQAILRDRVLLARSRALEKEGVKAPLLPDAYESEEKETANVLSVIENLAASSSCAITNIKPLGAKKVGSYKDISFEVTGEGDIQGIAKFLYEVETSKDMLRIRRFYDYIQNERFISPKIRIHNK